MPAAKTKELAGHELQLEKFIDAPSHLIWRAWAEPELLKQWFAPLPWTTPDVEIDLRPGGAFRTVMRSPEGTDFPNEGCILEAVPNQRIVMTDALVRGFRPSLQPFFSAVITLEPAGAGTKYHVRAIHKDAEGCKKHEEMGFHTGWGQCLDQLAALVMKLKSSG